MFKKEIAEIISKKVNLKKQEIEENIEVPPLQEIGDYAFPCFILAERQKKNPINIAENLKEEIKTLKNLSSAGIEKIESKGAYVNFFIDQKKFAQAVLKNVNSSYGRENIGKKRKIVIDFSSPNIGKPMHIGHIRSTILGDSLIRIYSYLGYNPIGINYLGDIGLHIGKLIVACEMWLNREALKENPVKELLRLYIKFCEKENSEFSESQEEDYKGNEWTEKARAKLKLIELGDKKTHAIWEEIRRASGKGFDKIYQLLKVNFHETTGQSRFSEAGKEIVINGVKNGLAKIDRESGAIFVDFENLPRKYVLRKNKTAPYMTQDIGSAVERYKKYQFDKMIYVTDFRQSLHFKQLFEILKKFGFAFYDKCVHIGFGTVNFGKEIMASRTGKIILLEEVLKKTIEKAKEEIKKRGTRGDPEKIGVGAIKYIILRNEPVKDVEFSWKTALNFEGETGPYIQYSYARASSILRKAKTKAELDIDYNLDKKETALIKKIADFPYVIKDAERTLNPSLIANYAFSLAQIFNEFYQVCKVIGSKEEQFRLKLTECFKTTIKNALYLLGIEVMEEM